MMSRTVTFFLAVVLSVVACAAENGAVVFRSDRGIITRAEIRCPANQKDERRCHDMEQSSLRIRIIRQMVDSAAMAYSIRPSAAEQAEIAKRTQVAHEQNLQLTKRYRQMAEAARRLQSGASFESAYESLDQKQIARDEFADYLAHFDTKERLDRVLRRDLVAEWDADYSNGLTREIVIARLSDEVARRAKASSTSFDVAADEMWRDVMSRSHAELVDSDYELPDLKGVFANHEQAIAVRPRR